MPTDLEVWGYSTQLDCIVMAAMREETAVSLLERYPDAKVVYFFASLDTSAV